MDDAEAESMRIGAWKRHMVLSESRVVLGVSVEFESFLINTELFGSNTFSLVSGWIMGMAYLRLLTLSLLAPSCGWAAATGGVGSEVVEKPLATAGTPVTLGTVGKVVALLLCKCGAYVCNPPGGWGSGAVIPAGANIGCWDTFLHLLVLVLIFWEN